MAETILYGIAQQLLQNLGSTAVQEIASAWGFETQLRKLEDTTNAIKASLLDAEDRQAESHPVRHWLERLRRVVYEADDLFDEFATVAARKQASTGNRVINEVRLFFSSSNQVIFACGMKQRIKEIRGKLDDVAKDAADLGLRLCPTEEKVVVSRVREQTSSFLDVEEVVGRDDDKKEIVNMLLMSTNVDENVSVTSIYGVGGLGKTTLAQWVIRDPQFEDHFQLRLWVCVSDVFDIKEIIKQVLKSATNKEPENLETDQMQSQLQKEVGTKKYLLVLDDVWNENRDEWLRLKSYLLVGGVGSKILVTTRSQRVAEIMGSAHSHELKGLSEAKSWLLFEKMAFKPGQKEANPELVEIGKHILQKCANVPLAIRTLGCLLYGTDERKWLSVRDSELFNVAPNGTENKVMNVLSFSYKHLTSALKQCFAFCALVPKDFEMKKETLVNLWIAEGFINAQSCGSQSLEEVGEEYFMNLLHRCFFQDIKRDEWGNVFSCKMHDLMHDLAKKVAGDQIAVAQSEEMKFDEGVRHVSLYLSCEIPRSLFKLKTLRTLICSRRSYDVDRRISRLRTLRVLDLSWVRGPKVSLLSSIGKLAHLRYLNLSFSDIKQLPWSITELHNLQILVLFNFNKLRSLPEDIGKLTNLRYLDLTSCSTLTQLPGSITELHNLQMLKLVVCYELRSLPEDIGKLTNLRYLHLTGCGTLTQLPGSITELHNLQMLKLVGCYKLRSLPEDIGKLTNLRCLKLGHCELLSHMPSGMGKLTELRTLDRFILGTRHTSCLDFKATAAQLRDLKALRYLTGELEISIRGKLENLVVDAKQSILRSKSGLVGLQIKCDEGEESSDDEAVLVLEGLQPPPNIKKLDISSYGGERLPSWASLEQLTCALPNLVEICLSNCRRCLYLPLFGQLPFLKHLVLIGLGSVVYIESDTLPPSSALFFPSLERLELRNMKRLRGWRKVTDEGRDCIHGSEAPASTSSLSAVAAIEATKQSQQHHHHLGASSSSSSSWHPPSFPKLAELRVVYCPKMTSMPLIPCVELLHLKHVNGNLMRTVFAFGSGTRSASKLKQLEIHCEKHLISIPKDCLMALEVLLISGGGELEFSNSSDDNGIIPWNALQNLRTLGFYWVPKMMALPDGLQYITTLQSLEIRGCHGLKGLPAEWISNLTLLETLKLRECCGLECLPEGIRFLPKLKHLEIWKCSETLKERCRDPDGEDWHLICHIPNVRISV